MGPLLLSNFPLKTVPFVYGCKAPRALKSLKELFDINNVSREDAYTR